MARFRPVVRRSGRDRRACLVSASLVLLLSLVAPASAQPTDKPMLVAHRQIKVGNDGDDMLVRYTTAGEPLEQFTGFSHISDVTLYDADTVLVAEEDRDRVVAMALDGRLLWTLPVHRPKCVEVLGPDRFLVCGDDPPQVVEIDRRGQTYWSISQPLREATGAIRLPDGNTAVVEGRNPHAVHVFSPDGKILWSGTELLVRPRGLALLPTGELVTAGFDSGRAVMFRPYTNEVRSLDYHGHGIDVSVTPGGDLLTFAPEHQLVRLWAQARERAWEFVTLYPPLHGTLLPDGTVLVSVFRKPDRVCTNATEAAQRASQPRPTYWKWFGAGLASSLFVVIVVQWPALRGLRRWSRGGEARNRAESGPMEGSAAQAPPSAAAPRRRIEVGVTLVAALALAVFAALNLPPVPPSNTGALSTYVGSVLLSGILLAWLQTRTPAERDEWTVRMGELRRMPRPTWRMWALWGTGAALIAGTIYAMSHGGDNPAFGLWIAAIVTLAGGSIEQSLRLRPLRLTAAIAAVLLVLFIAIPRVYRLEVYPPNLHLDMSLWSVQVMEFLDGKTATPFTNGWAEIPMLGYLWSALWTAVAGRSLTGVRISSSIGGGIAILATYFLTRRLYNVRAALLATVLLSVNHAYLHFSRIQHYMDPVPFQVLAVLGLIGGLETGRYGWFALSGLAGGFSALAYHSGRITPPLLVLSLALLLLRYPRTVGKRWPGLLLCAVVLGATLAPQAVVYATGRSNPFGRDTVFAWVQGGHINQAALWQTLAAGLPRVLGTFWFFTDTSTQYGGFAPAFFPPVATLFGMAVIAVVLRLTDVRGLWLLLWSLLVLMVGGVLTIDPPFWPRFFAAFIPATVLAAVAADTLYRAACFAAGRLGAVIGTAGLIALLAVTSWQNADVYMGYCAGRPPDRSEPIFRSEWVQSIMGRDVQRWGKDALIYIVATNPIEQSCAHPTMMFYDYAVDAKDARLISDYLPFDDSRTIVCYFLPGTTSQIDLVRQLYPNAELTPFHDNLGRAVFTRLVVPPPAFAPLKDPPGDSGGNVEIMPLYRAAPADPACGARKPPADGTASG